MVKLIDKDRGVLPLQIEGEQGYMKLGIGVHTPDSISLYLSINAAKAWYSAVLRKTNQIITSYFSMQSHAEMA